MKKKRSQSGVIRKFFENPQKCSQNSAKIEEI